MKKSFKYLSKDSLPNYVAGCCSSLLAIKASMIFAKYACMVTKMHMVHSIQDVVSRRFHTKIQMSLSTLCYEDRFNCSHFTAVDNVTT